MNKLIHYSSITKKVITGLAGLFLALFLCVHLIINLLLLVDDGGKMYMEASAFMGTNIIIKIFEIFLFGGFLIHIIFALIVTFRNWISRPVSYYKANKSETSLFSKYMFHTGIIILIFLILHFMNFFFVKHGIVKPPAGVDTHDFYKMAAILFKNEFYSIVYIIFFVFMAFHLNHSIQSAFQTLGLHHRTYDTAIKWCSAIYSIIISVGFAIIPIYFMFFHQTY